MGQTSRLLGVTTILPIEEDAKRAYLQPAPQLAQALDAIPVFRTLTETPLALAIFRATYAGSATTLRALVELDVHTLREKMLTSYVERRYAEAASRRALPISLQELRAILSELAYRNAAGAPHSQAPGIVRAHDLTLLPPDWQSVFVDVAVHLGLLMARADGSLRFPHLIWRDHFAYPLAAARLRESDPTVRRQAVEALGQIADERVITPLVVILGDSDGSIQDRAAHALRHLGTAAIPMLLRALNAPNERIRLQAKVVLATMPGPEGKDALRRVLASGS
jgi:hypothetical protein